MSSTRTQSQVSIATPILPLTQCSDFISAIAFVMWQQLFQKSRTSKHMSVGGLENFNNKGQIMLVILREIWFTKK